MTNEELVASVCPILNDNGWKYYFNPETASRGKALGLKGMEFYVAGRGGALGDCDGSVVAAAFGYFNPIIINAAWSLATAKVPARELGFAHYECAAALGREKLSAVANLQAFVDAAEKVNTAADPDGLALYAAFKSLPLAEDAPARAMQLMATLREFRGSAHLVAIRALGLTSKQAHYVKRPNDVANFGWGEADAPHIDDSVREKMKKVEDLTDQLVLPAYGVLDEAGRTALLEGAKAIAAALAN